MRADRRLRKNASRMNHAPPLPPAFRKTSAEHGYAPAPATRTAPERIGNAPAVRDARDQEKTIRLTAIRAMPVTTP